MYLPGNTRAFCRTGRHGAAPIGSISPVDRPMIGETTALGAAYLAGLAAGVYPEPAKFADNWRLQHRFKPAMNSATWRDSVIQSRRDRARHAARR
jgi:glycerol kinase